MVFAAGIACIATAVATGRADVNLVLIFPVFSGSSWLFILGTLLIVLSFLVGFAMLAMGRAEVEHVQSAAAIPGPLETQQKKTLYGGAVLIGPFPIAFGSSKSMAIFMLAIAIALAVLFLVVLLVL